VFEYTLVRPFQPIRQETNPHTPAPEELQPISKCPFFPIAQYRQIHKKYIFQYCGFSVLICWVLYVLGLVELCSKYIDEVADGCRQGTASRLRDFCSDVRWDASSNTVGNWLFRSLDVLICRPISYVIRRPTLWALGRVFTGRRNADDSIRSLNNSSAEIIVVDDLVQVQKPGVKFSGPRGSNPMLWLRPLSPPCTSRKPRPPLQAVKNFYSVSHKMCYFCCFYNIFGKSSQILVTFIVRLR